MILLYNIDMINAMVLAETGKNIEKQDMNEKVKHNKNETIRKFSSYYIGKQERGR